MPIELKHLRCAEMAERCGSFRKAADLLALKQSNLSRRVRHLEEQLGIALIERTNGGVRPTAAGRDFVNGVRRILYELQIIVDTVSRVRLAFAAACSDAGFDPATCHHDRPRRTMTTRAVGDQPSARSQSLITDGVSAALLG